MVNDYKILNPSTNNRKEINDNVSKFRESTCNGVTVRALSTAAD